MAAAELRAFSLTGGSSRVGDRNLLLKEKVTIRQCLVSRSPRQKAADGVTRRWEERGGVPKKYFIVPLRASVPSRAPAYPQKNLVARPILASPRSGIASFRISRHFQNPICQRMRSWPPVPWEPTRRQRFSFTSRNSAVPFTDPTRTGRFSELADASRFGIRSDLLAWAAPSAGIEHCVSLPTR